MTSYRIGIISLGCAKNQVDCELMLSKLTRAGFEVTDDVENTDAVLINTCGFIEDAKKEAIDNILYAAELKEQGLTRAVIVTGCLAQRYGEEVKTEIPEIDALVGLGSNGDIAEICKRAIEGEPTVTLPDVSCMPLDGERVLTTPAYTAYLRVADGCSNKCTYCAIPLIRGEYRSRKMESILDEAQKLVNGGAKELVVIAQDTTRYGLDIYGKLMLPELLKKLCRIEKLDWVRVMYCYPDFITDELLETIASEEKICNYLDLPLQHANGDVLKAMNRRGDKDSLLALVEKIRRIIPDVVLRTTLITGFPGESEDAFVDLYDFVKKAEFDRLGCFTYSAEEGTPAAEFDSQVDDEIKAERLDIIMRLQQEITMERNAERIGKQYKVLVEGYDGYSDSYYGRSYSDAMEIDTQVFFTSAVELFEGEFVTVKIINADGYDLIGETLDLI